jgi:hypothetical protein
VHVVAAQAEQEDPTPRILHPPGHSLITAVLFFGFFFPKKERKKWCSGGHLHHFLRETPDIFGWLYSELYFGRFQTDGLKNRTLIKKVFVGDRPFFGAF